MNESYLKYYERYSSMAGVRFSWDALRAKSPRRRIALRNRQKDYVNLAGNDRLLALHHRLNSHLLASAREWSSYDYGEGYFYQGLAQIGITGLRDTEARIQQMELARTLSGLDVLEIGCNTGFVSLACASVAQWVTGFDVNPYLVAIANDSAAYLECRNASYTVCAFEDFVADRQFDAVVSFANHSTYDGNTHQSIEAYFDRCHALTRPGGLLLFESHPPSHEGDGLIGVISAIERLYAVELRRVLDYGSFLDAGRTFVVARRAAD